MSEHPEKNKEAPEEEAAKEEAEEEGREGVDRREASGEAAPKTWRDHREIRLQAPVERVWKCWAEPEHIAGWFADRAGGTAEPGGTLTHYFDAFGMELPHEVLEVEPGERLVLQGRAPTGVAFRQEIRVRRQEGKTVLELIHSGFDEGADWEDEYEGVDSGWKLALAILERYVTRHFGKARTPYFAMRPTAFEYDHLQPLFRHPEQLARWLGRPTDATGLAESREVELDLRGEHTPGDGSLSGRVLVDSGREIALSWEEIDGVLELKAFGMGPGQRAVALRASSWSQRPPAKNEVEAWMTEALDRLADALETETESVTS